DHIRILTNHHCFAISDETGKSTDKLRPNVCEHTQVVFNTTQGVKESEIVVADCFPNTLASHPTTDIASFVVTGNIPASIDSLKIRNNDDIEKEMPAYIVHFPIGVDYIHLNRNQKSIRLPATIITEDDCKVLGDFEPIQWNNNPVLALSHKHTCDLTEGSSGSPIIDQKTNEVIGINWGGVKSIRDNSEYEISNASVKASFIQQYLYDYYQLDPQIDTLLAGAEGLEEKNEADNFIRQTGCVAEAATLSRSHVSSRMLASYGSSKSDILLFLLLIFLPVIVIFPSIKVLWRSY
ncbi:MAG: trypsin-like peptidase domain-containing protein, partial [Proteobacteria bacterium]|nr:trypsin-like peptidase domain-containing protein [Pseudomonadota bacterium]